MNTQDQLEQTVWAIESAAGLACTCLGMGQGDRAMALVEEVLLYLADHSLDGAREPYLVFWNCYRVLDGCRDSRAAEVLEEAHRRLQAQAATIGSERLRHSFLENVRAHRAIGQAVRVTR